VLQLSSPGVKQEEELSGEIELLKSRLFFNKVVDAVDLDVSYYKYGRVLDDERFENSPVHISYKVLNDDYYDRPIDLEILDDKRFTLPALSEETFEFGKDISIGDLNLWVEKSNHFSQNAVGAYYFKINSREALVNFLKANVQVVPESFTAKTLRISLQDHNRRKAQYLVNVIDSVYEIYTRNAKNRALEQKISFLDERIDATEEVLQKYENYFENFTISNRSTNVGSDLSQTIITLDKLDSMHFNIRSQQEEIRFLKEQILEDDPMLINEIFLQRFPAPVTTLLQEYQEIVKNRRLKLASYNENTFIIQRLDEELELAETRLMAMVAGMEEQLEERLKRVKTQKAFLEGSLLQMPSLETEYTKNRRLYGQQEEFMLSLRRAKMELELTKAGTVTDIIILSSASYPSTPVKPQKVLIYALGLVAGLFLSVLFILVRYLINNKVTSLGELERLVSVPILGSLPFYRQEKLDNTKLVIEKDARSSLSEALRTIRTNMEFMNGTGKKDIISVTSTISGEGKTFISVNLGAIIAISGQKVCVVDLDMRKPKIHMAFNNPMNHIGVSTILSGKSGVKESTVKTRIDALDYLPAGPTPPNPSELILGEGFDRMVEKLQKRYDIVILDTPPVGLVTDGILVMKKADLQLYVVRAGYSKRSFLKTIDNLKKTNKFNKLTVIFNSLKSGQGYGYGYVGRSQGKGYYQDEKVRPRRFLNFFRSLF
jgi:capsular exopolysaccharide synthesis family protein